MFTERFKQYFTNLPTLHNTCYKRRNVHLSITTNSENQAELLQIQILAVK